MHVSYATDWKPIDFQDYKPNSAFFLMIFYM